MSDVLNPEQRSYCMSQIRGSGTKPEILLRKIVWKLGLRYRLKSNVTGKPDLVFMGARVAVFVDGCQWHCCPDHWVRPKSNTAFWDAKFQRNRDRDIKVNDLLRAADWMVLRFWEHEVKRTPGQVASRIARAVRKRVGAERRADSG